MNATTTHTKFRTVPTAPDPAFEERVSALVHAAVGVVDHLRNQQLPGLPDATVEIWVTDDLAASVRSLDGRVVGVESLANYASVRLGDGRVMGKTMFFDEAHAQAVVVLDASMFRVPGAHGQALSMQLLGHELEHVRIGQVRTVGGTAMTPSWKPQESSRWFALHAIGMSPAEWWGSR